MFKLNLPHKPTDSPPAADSPAATVPVERQGAPDHVEPAVANRDPVPANRVRVPSFLLQRPTDTEVAIAEEVSRRVARKGLTR